MKILGIDPSLSSSGWVFLNNGKVKDFGIVKTKTSDEKRFLYISDEFEKIIKKYKPDEIHIETPFFGKNGQSSLNLAYVRGVLLVLSERLDIPLISFAPQEIKKALTGSGRAGKDEIATELTKMYKDDKVFLKIGPFSDKNNKDKTSDIYDALAAATCKKEKKEEE